MKAIEILFVKIDELNAQLKIAEDLDDKYRYAELIGDCVAAIKCLSRDRFSCGVNGSEHYL